MLKTKSKIKTINIVLLVLLFGLVFLLEQIIPPSHLLFTVLKKGSIYALVAVSMNLLNGFTGLFSLGQAGFMLIGGYVYAMLTVYSGSRDSVYKYYDSAINFSLQEVFTFGGALPNSVGLILGVLAALIAAGLAAAFFAWLIGMPVLRLKSDYLAIATLGFAEIIRAIFQWDKLGPITNGSNLLKNYPTFNNFNIIGPDGKVAVYLSTFVPFLIVGLCIAVIVMLINSSYGRAFKAIREDEIAAEAMGINLARHKMMSFIISSFFAGVGGALLAMFQNTVAATPFKSAMTYEILLIVVIGGIGSVTGSCISSFLFIAASEWWLRGLDNGKFLFIESPTVLRSGFRRVVFAVIIMAIVLFYRRGIMGDKEFSVVRIANRFKRWFGPKKKDGAVPAGGSGGEGNE